MFTLEINNNRTVDCIQYKYQYGVGWYSIVNNVNNIKPYTRDRPQTDGNVLFNCVCTYIRNPNQTSKTVYY